MKWHQRDYFLGRLNLPSAVSRLGAEESCPRNWTTNSGFSQLFIGCRENRVEPLSGTAPLRQRGTHLCVRKCFSVTFTHTPPPPLPAPPSSPSKPTLCPLSLDQTAMFSRSKKRRDGGSREVGRWPKVRRLHGARRDALRLQIRCLF